MKSNIFTKTVKKTTLWSAILAVLLAAAIVVCALFGFNADKTLQSNKTLTVSMNSFVYNTNKDAVLADCETICGKMDIDYVIEGEMSGDTCELIFVFDESVDVATLKTAVEDHFNAKTATGSEWEGAFIDVTASTEGVTATLAEDYVLRGTLAGLALAIVVMAYVAIRYKKFSVGLVASVSVALGMLLTAALLILTRTPVTATAAAVIAVGGLLTAVMVMLTLGKIRAAEKEESGASVSDSIAVKEILLLSVGLAVAMVVVGILGKTFAAWFAVSALLAILASVFVSLFFAPAMYVSVQEIVAKRPAKEGYKGAKKTSTKAKKVFASKKAEEVVEEQAEETPVATEAAPAEEPSEEAPVEELIEETEEIAVEEEETPTETEENVEE